MRNEERKPGRGIRSLQMWRRVSEARKAADDAQAEGKPVSTELLVAAGIDQQLLEQVHAELERPVSVPAALTPDPSGAGEDEGSAQDGCVVRSKSGRISLRTVDR